MPIINEVKYSGISGKQGHIWLACPACGKEKWVVMSYAKRKQFKVFCVSCGIKDHYAREPMAHGENSPNWKGGRTKDGNGYIQIWIQAEDFFYQMAQQQGKIKGYVREHRLVMAKFLGRNLHRWEVVHHRNGIKTDNRIENLQLVSDDRHNQITILENRIAHLEAEIVKLKNDRSRHLNAPIISWRLELNGALDSLGSGQPSI